MMRLRHIGATIRCEGAPLLRSTIRPRTPAPKTRGAPRLTWHQQTEQDLEIAQLQSTDAHDMRKWKKGIRDLGIATSEDPREDSKENDEENYSDGHKDDETGEDVTKH